MAIKVTAGDLVRDRARIIQAIGKWLTPQSSDLRYDWLYLNSPAGPARVWLAENEKGVLVGIGSAFARKMYCAGSKQDPEIDGCIFGDFGVAPEHRSVGLALQLQRACFESLEMGWAKIAYDFPSSGMMAIYKRLGRGSALPFVRTAKPLRADRKVQAKIPVKVLAKAASTVANRVLALSDKTSSAQNGYTITRHEGRCDAQFDALAEMASPAIGCCVSRSAEYLNWRYLDHPTNRFEIFTAYGHGKLAGYLAMTKETDQARIVDLFGLQEDAVLDALIAQAVQVARDGGAETLSAPVVSSSPQHAALGKQGFKDRESAAALVFEPGAAETSSKSKSANWFLMDGDRDS